MQTPSMINPESLKVSTFPREWFLEYDPDRSGKIREIEKVRIGKKGDPNYERIESVERLRKHNEAEWTAFAPYYDHWKKGLEPPVDGTPLTAFPLATPQLIKALAPFDIKSIEDLANITDDAMNRIVFPRLRSLKTDAQVFLEARRNQQGLAGELADAKDTIARLTEVVAALTEQVENLKPKRGRKNEPAVDRQ